MPTGSRLFRPDTLTSQSPRNDGQFPVKLKGAQYTPGRGFWKTNREGMERLITAGRLRPTVGDSLQYVRFLDDFPVVKRNNFWPDGLTGSFTEDKVYVVQSPTKIVARCILMATDPGDLVLDPTCGSGTTAFAAEQWARRWITIDTSRVAIALARTRLMAAKYPYYLLADSPEGIRKEAELTGKTPPAYKTENDVKRGFIYNRVPHVTLKSIANNPEIKEGMSREQIDAAIRKHADTEFLYDDPYEDNKRIRVTGPLTVESLSPHRVLTTDEERPATEVEGKKAIRHRAVRDLNHRKSQSRRRPEHPQSRTAQVRFFGILCRNLVARNGNLHGEGQEPARGGVSWPGTRHGRPGTSERSGQRSRARRGL